MPASVPIQQAVSSGQPAAMGQRGALARQGSKLRARGRGARMNSTMFDHEAAIMSEDGGHRGDDDYLYQQNTFADAGALAGAVPGGDFNYDELLQNPGRGPSGPEDSHKGGFFAHGGADTGMGSFIGGGERATRQGGNYRSLLHKSSMLSNTNSIVPNFGRGAL